MFYGERRPLPEFPEGVGGALATDTRFRALPSRLEAAFVDRVLSHVVRPGRVLDVGCRAGEIALLLARRAPALHVVGIDRSQAMIAAARRAAKEDGLDDRVRFLVGDAKRLPLASGSFDLLVSNSLLHRLSALLPALNEGARVLRVGAPIVFRDLRRPHRLVLPLHVAWRGRERRGAERRLLAESLRAAYSEKELGDLLDRSRIVGASIHREGSTHVLIERFAPARGANAPRTSRRDDG